MQTQFTKYLRKFVVALYYCSIRRIYSVLEKVAMSSTRQLPIRRTGVCLVLLFLLPNLASALETEDILFYSSFEGEIQAEIAKGSPIGKQIGNISYAEGKTGKGIVVGEGEAKFSSEGNIWPERGTIEMWIKPLDWRGDDNEFHSLFSLKKLKLVKTQDNQLSFTVKGEGMQGIESFQGITTRCIWSENTWHQLIVTWDEEEMKLYIDGKLYQRRVGVDVPQSWENEEFCIGGLETAKKTHTLIDELYIYKRPLSEEEIEATYQDKHKGIPSPGLKIGIDYLLFEKLIKVKVDIGGLRNIPEEAFALLELYQKDEKKILAKGRIDKFKRDVGRVSLDISKLPIGEYIVRCVILDKKGEFLSKGETSFVKETDLTWEQVEKIGVSDIVPFPWTPLEVKENLVNCWGRSYKFGRFALPEQITTKGKEIFAVPIQVSLVLPNLLAGGEPISWQGGETKIISTNKDKVELESKAKVSFPAHLELAIKTSLEYDGFMKVNIKLTPLQPTQITDFTLEISLKEENAKYFWARPYYQHPFTSGELPKEEGRIWTGRFLPFIWIGDEDRGFTWYCESDQDWIIKKESRVIEIRREENMVKLLIHFIDNPCLLDSPFQTTFALQATPVRPMPVGWRNWRLIGEKKPGHIWYIWWSVYSGINGVPAFSYPRVKEPAFFKQLVEDYHKNGVKVIPYVAVSEMATNTPEGRFYAKEWMTLPFCSLGDNSGNLVGSSIYTCPNSHWVDFIVWAVEDMVKRYDIDGMYFDNFFPRGCHNSEHGCGYVDKKGEIKDTYPIFRIRELMKRLRVVFLEHNKESFLMTSSKPYPCFIGDLCGHGEGSTMVNIPDDEAQKKQLGKIRAEFMGRQWGIPLFLLPQLNHGYVRDEDRAPFTEYLLAQILPHDIPIWPAYMDLTILEERWEKVIEDFGMEGVEFIPYWESPPIISNLPDLVISSAWVKQGKALLIVSNLSQEGFSGEVKVNFKKLLLSKGKVKVYETPKYTEIPVNEDKIELSIRPRNFKVLILNEVPDGNK